jgi:hypothetical protein
MRALLVEGGIGPGDRVAILVGNESVFAPAYLGILGVRFDDGGQVHGQIIPCPESKTE